MKRFAIGAICNYVHNLHPFIDFISNARDHGYEPDRLIICYSHGYKSEIVEELQNIISLDLVQMNYDPDFSYELIKAGLNKEQINYLLRTPEFDYHRLISYGKRRNIVVLKSLIIEPKLDYLFFIDTDVQPGLLTSKDGTLTSINFFGRHFDYLKKKNVVITTSDYSGYYIIPPLFFKGRNRLLQGLQKDEAIDKIRKLKFNLILTSILQKNVRETDKILGGNHAIDLNYACILPPFYSTSYIYRNKLFLGRGEDTLWGLEIPDKKHKIIDIDTHIFHDTYSDFPREPNIDDQDVQKRFFYACTGWLGRNPFLNWYLQKHGYISSEKYKKRYQKQKEAITVAAPALGRYTKNENFLNLPEIFSAAWMQLDKMIEDYKKTHKVWQDVMNIIAERRDKQ